MTASQQTQTSQQILIVGGTGKTGRRVAQRLAAAGRTARIASRTGAPAFEWSDRATWPAVLRGVAAVYLAYHPDLAAPGALEDVRAFSELAVASGVRRIVLLSGRGEPAAQAAEEVVRASGAATTIVRAAFFAQNFSEGMLRDPVLEGVVAFPGGAVAEPFVDLEDLAEVATAAVLDERHAGQIYELTGPRLLTFGEAVAEIARATGREVRYLPVSAGDYANALVPHVGPDAAAFLAELLASLLDGHNAHTADGVMRALGRPARDFREFARDAARAGAWAA